MSASGLIVAPRHFGGWALLLGALTVVLSGCGDGDPASDGRKSSAAEPAETAGVESLSSDASQVRALVASEELILALTPRLRALSHSVLNLKLPDHAGRNLFEPTIRLVDLASDAATQPTARRLATISAREQQLPVAAEAVEQKRDALVMWRGLLRETAYFEHAKFYIVRGEFLGQGFDTFQTEIGFAGLARTTAGNWRSVKATQQVLWRRSATAARDANAWQIAEWKLNEMTTMDRGELLFTDVLDHVIPDDDQRQRARLSKHRSIMMRHYYPGAAFKLPEGYRDGRFFKEATALHPGLAVVDIDGDGFDDLYITVRWGKNQLLRNRGDGTFEEVAARFGLDIEGRTSGAIFADFDNDGDLDLMLGRSFQRSMYLVNENGRFVDRSESLVATPLPFLVTSLSAVDYNGDGLLDVYFSSYYPEYIASRADADLGDPQHWIHNLLTSEQSKGLTEHFRKEHRSFIEQVGPPNVLLVNRGGGRFELAPENAQLEVWRNTFQSVWADYDDDGDPDLYVSNDFAPDQLFRNDGPRGFVDVTSQAGVDLVGFGMGASWGDYDNDGRQDLYVSNMYSKAGMRITRQIDRLDVRFGRLADGNYLYRNRGERFEKVSGLKPPELTVARAGWSWGGQFVDIDNDGFLDIYVSSGYYTVPEEFETTVDL
ncbi:MAG: VCBS repeat-containing protein [Planctomycetes bacterium]|nr:VCBS repeat-containing protein [Planctomycetota bacterium]